MAILNFKRLFPGQLDDIKPADVRMYCDDALAAVATAGYLNAYFAHNNQFVESTDLVHVAASDGQQIYYPVIAADGTITLTVLP